MLAVMSVARTLVYPGPKCPEAATQVIPLLHALLPGLDPNDSRKSMTAFQFITTFCTLVPLVDSSAAFEHHGETMTEEERTICSQTAEFEDFIAQFLDRCFALIESSTFQVSEVSCSTTN